MIHVGEVVTALAVTRRRLLEYRDHGREIDQRAEREPDACDALLREDVVGPTPAIELERAPLIERPSVAVS
jgi:hypothetical protein